MTLRTGGQPCVCFDKMAVKGTGTRGFLSGYFNGLQQTEIKERHSAELKDINGQDPYEIRKNEWLDDLDFLPSVTYTGDIHSCRNVPAFQRKSIHTRAAYELHKLGLLSELCQQTDGFERFSVRKNF